MHMLPEELSREVRKLGFDLRPDQLQGLRVYLQLLVKWNRAVNLVGYMQWRDILHYLVVDSFHLERFLRDMYLPERLRTLDLGAGAGLPGIPLRLVWKLGEYYLVESRMKKAAFIRQVIHETGLGATYVLNQRVEDLKSKHLPAELIVSRAFMPWPKLLPMAGNMLAKSGILVILAGEKPPERGLQVFSLLKTMAYRVKDKSRYFWALEKTAPGDYVSPKV